MSEAIMKHMTALVGGYRITQALHVAAKLEVADKLGDQPQTVDTLAEKVNADRDRLYRVMRFLTAHGVFREGPLGTFENTAYSNTMRIDSEYKFRDFVLLEADLIFRPATHLPTIVRSPSTTGPELAMGMPFWKYLEDNPSKASTFSSAMISTKHAFRDGFADHLPSDLAAGSGDVIADVGGGKGHMVADILATRPQASAIVLELEQVRPDFDVFVAEVEPSIGSRMEFKFGDFFDSNCIPKAAALYVLGFIMHNWSDEDCLRILRAVRTAMVPESRLLVLEGLVEDMNETGPIKDLDLSMLSLFSGKERTREEFSKLFSHADMELAEVVSFGRAVSNIIAKPVSK